MRRHGVHHAEVPEDRQREAQLLEGLHRSKDSQAGR